MAPVTNGKLLFNEVPTGYPEPGKTTVYDNTETIDLENVPLNGGFLVKTLVLSIDPYLRGRMREEHIKSYAHAFIKGQPLINFGVGVVLRSEHPSVTPGDHLYGFHPFQQYFVASELKPLRVLKNEEKLPWSAYVGVCGMPGQTAYHGWKEFANAKKDDVVFVTAGAGPVGATVIQLAKSDGCKVIASAGSEEKVKFMKSIGVDVAFNYKTEKTSEVLKREGPIDIYWDNVGGESLEAALDNAAKHARFIECGMISSYNGTPSPINNLQNVFAKEITMHGFLVGSLRAKYDDAFYREVPRMVAEGKIKWSEDRTIGLERAGHAILDVQQGRNNGKSVVVVAED